MSDDKRKQDLATNFLGTRRPMTNKRIREAVEKMTPGDWDAYAYDGSNVARDWRIFAEGTGWIHPMSRSDAEGICVLRNEVPALLDELDRLRESERFYRNEAESARDDANGMRALYDEAVAERDRLLGLVDGALALRNECEGPMDGYGLMVAMGEVLRRAGEG